ncbi:cell division protein ZapE [Oleiagrimonas sp. MCCC 1A03011]|uniref:cell division protein ZapE n=1 Tax=Oleiagrimonas sp. MCCC 1A03011 TaxID=1926883 RepID=UPI000DC1FB8E|nr:cell division protein ZapE [Oleiagrimonas sp. MCCC 1A03011]RAP58120.1 cell division protein ZapE [Oleiagrimonas sp. MCCC 1A03011]
MPEFDPAPHADADHAIRPSQRYREGVAAHRWESDPSQQAALVEFDRLHDALCARPRPERGVLGRLRSLLNNDVPDAPDGLYLWGRVGRGKTFLMDLFVAGLPQGVALRRHFHRFMREVHEALREHEKRQQSDPLQQIAADLAARARVLCLDEFIVDDIGDAMILGGLLRGLFARGVALVTTSNTAPANLYADGLQRARFVPAIRQIEQHCRVLEMTSGHDWRLRALEQAPIYQTPPGPEASHVLQRIFADYAEGDVDEGGELRINDRPIAVQRRADNIAWFDFDALCDGPRGNDDYIELARRFPAVVIGNVPIFGLYNNDPARRFIHLVDEFYDRHVKLVLSAAAPIIDLYEGDRLRAEFGRTESRLIEMQSQDYLALPHRPD